MSLRVFTILGIFAIILATISAHPQLRKYEDDLVSGTFVGFGEYQPAPAMQHIQYPTRNGDLVEGIFRSGFAQQDLPPTRRQKRQIAGTPPTATSTTAAPRTTPPPSYYRCLTTCPATNEYNPVCGSDAQNYYNAARLQCASRCGMNVQMIRMGTCLPL